MKTLEELKEEFYKIRPHLDGCLFELQERYNENNGVNSCTCGLEKEWQFIEEAIKEEREETKTIEEWEEDFWDIMRNDFGVVDFSGTQARAYELKQFISELIEKEKESAFDLGYITGRQVAIESIVN